MTNTYWQDLTMPKRLEIEKKTLTDTYGRFIAEPYERGFGATTGNSIRRALLSSITGAAITAVKIEGVFHEFCAMPCVLEDVTDILLNLKEIIIKMHSDETKEISLSVKRDGQVTAADIITGEDIEILNPDHHIATLSDGGELTMQMMVKKGRGYVPADENASEDLPIQMIPIDSVFSPVRKVNLNVESTSAGKSVDFERLTMEVMTDGSIRPDDAVAHAAHILKKHTQIYINFEEEQEEEEKPEEPPKVVSTIANLDRNVEELELSVRSQNCLKNAEIQILSELLVKTEFDLLQTKNFGKKSLTEIKEVLGQMGLKLGMKIDEK